MKKLMVLMIVILTVVFTLFATLGTAQVPQKINYQGYLEDASGNPVNGSLQMTFSMYDVATGGNALWNETQTVTLNDGRYNVSLGSVSPITLTETKPYWLGVKVGSDAEMTPRKEMTGTLYDVIQGSGTSSAAALWTESGGNIYRETGNVGIGTTDPIQKFYVDNTDSLNWPARMFFGHAVLSLQSTKASDAHYPYIEWRKGENRGAYLGWGQAGKYFDFRLESGNDLAIQGGNVGIGTTNPTAPLDVNGSLKVRGFCIELQGPDFQLGTNDNRDVGQRKGQRALVHIGNDELHINYAGDFEGGTRIAGSKLVIDGSVGMGTANPGGYRLAVNGKIRAKEIRVDSNWADFVFEDEYDLMPLSDVEQHIKAQKHLPGIPSAQEVQANGVSLGEMQTTLLQKIEELTLHLIEQDKRLTALQQENMLLKKELSALQQAHQ